MSLEGINIPFLGKTTITNTIVTGNGANGITGMGVSSQLPQTGLAILSGVGGVLITQQQVSSGTNFIISGSGLPANTIIVHTLADLPTPVDNRIALESHKIYRFVSGVDIGNNGLVLNTNNVILGSSPFNDFITSTYSGICISGTNKHFTVKDIGFVIVNGTVFDIRNPSAGIGTVRNNYFFACKDVGTLSGVDELNVIDNYFTNGCTNGIRVIGGGSTVRVNGNVHNANTSTYTGIALLSGTTPYNSALINGNIFDLSAGQTHIFANSGFATDGKLVDNTSNLFGVQISGGLVKSDPDWSFKNNLGLKDSLFAGAIRMTGNSTVTPITTAGTMVLASGFSLTGVLMERFQMSNSGEMRYLGKSPLEAEAVCSITIKSTTVAVKTLAATFLLNDSEMNNIIREVGVGTISDNITLNTFISLTSGDRIGIGVTNRTDTNSIVVQDYNFNIFKL
jgi:hypothetical protein